MNITRRNFLGGIGAAAVAVPVATQYSPMDLIPLNEAISADNDLMIYKENANVLSLRNGLLAVVDDCHCLSRPCVCPHRDLLWATRPRNIYHSYPPLKRDESEKV